MNVTTKIFEHPVCTSGTSSEQFPVSEEGNIAPTAASLDTERTIWDPDYRRWAINQLSRYGQL